jgi:hypothetical protein
VLVHCAAEGLADYNFSMRRRSSDGEEVNLVSDTQVPRSFDMVKVTITSISRSR